MKKTNNFRLFCTVTIVLVVTFIFTACSPVPKNQEEVKDLRVISDSITFITEENKIYAVFAPIENAKSYGYTLTGNNTGTIFEDGNNIKDFKLDFNNGYYFGEIEANGISDGIFTIYASKTNSIEEYTYSKSEEYKTPIDIDTIKPTAYVMNRGEKSVTLGIEIEPISGLMEYKIKIDNQEKTYDSLPIVIENLNPNSEYNITIYHKIKTSNTYGTKVQELTIPKYDSKDVLELSIDEDSKEFVISSIDGGGYNNLELLLNNVPIATFQGQRTSFFNEKLESLTSGVFSVQQKDNQGNIIATSNKVSYIIPLVIKDSEVTQQTFTATFDLNNDIISLLTNDNLENYLWINNSSITTEIINNTQDEITVRLSNMESKTNYSIKFTGTNNGYTTSIEEEFTTTSFAGKYTWTPQSPLSENHNWSNIENPNFSVIVEDAIESKDYKYYIYVAKDDEYFERATKLASISSYDENNRLRIMPLVDSSNPKEQDEIASGNYPKTRDAVQTSKYYMKAYVWNTEKWNSLITDVDASWSSFSKPSKLVSVDRNYQVQSTDVFSLLTKSGSLVGNIDTLTIFSFFDNGISSPKIKYYNKITDGTGMNTGNKALRKNPDTYQNVNAEDNPYTFILEKQPN